MSRVALFTLATGERYHQYARINLPVTQKFFCPNHETDFFCFSDLDLKIKGVTCLPARRMVWPFISFWKSIYIDNFLRERALDNYYDYVFFLDADSCIISLVNDEVLHDSLFIINVPWAHQNVVAGGFYGGTPDLMHKIAEANREYLKVACERRHFECTNDEYVLTRVYQELRVKTVLDCDWKLLSKDFQFLPRVPRHELPQVMGKGYFLINLDIPEQGKFKASDFLCTHPGWKDYVEIDMEEGWVSHKGDIAKLERISSFIYKLNWWDYPNSDEYLDIRNGQIMIGRPLSIATID